MRYFRSISAGLAAMACVIALRADLGPWVQHIAGTSALRAVFFRDVQLPGGIVPSRRPPRETIPALAKNHELRALEAELNLDFTLAESSWKAYGDTVALADYYHRRLDVPKELEALLAARLFARALDLARNHALEANRIYGAWIQQEPDRRETYESYADYLLASAQYSEAETLAAAYAKRFPNDDLFPIRIRAEIAERRGSVADALKIYDAAFRPLASPAYVAKYFVLLDRSRQLRAFVGRARDAAAREPLSLEPAVRLFYYHQQGGRLPDAHRALLEFAARKTQWTEQEQITLAKLFEATQNWAEAARYYNEAWKRHQSEEGLAGVIGVLFVAPEQELGIGQGDLTFYRDIATIDRYPGTLNGILSLLFNTTYPRSQFAEQEQAAVPYFHRAKAAELIGELEKRFPNSSRREDLRARLIQSYATYGANDAVIRLGGEYLTAFPKAPQRTHVALAMADAYARLDRTTDEFRVYDELLKELGAAAKGVPLGSASDVLPEIPQGDAQPQQRLPGGPAKSPQYAQVLDRYLSRLVSTKRIKEALALYRTEIDRNPDDPGLYERLAAFMAQNRMATSIADVYTRAMRRFQDKSWHHKLARWYLRRQQTAAFEKVSREFIRVFSGSDLEQYFNRVVAGANLDAVLYRELNRFAHQRFPSDLVFVRNLISAYERKGTADPVAREALLRRHWYYDEGLRAQFFQTLSSRGKLDAELQAIEASKSSEHAALQFIAEGRAWQSHFEDAVKPADALAAQFPGETGLNERSASLFRSFERTDEAIRASERISRTTPRNRDILARLGDIRAQKEQFSEARKYWDRIPAVEPGNPDGYLEAATVYWDWFRYDDALRIINEGRTKLRDTAAFAYEAGAIQENKRDYTAAIAEYLKHPQDRALRRLIRLAERRDTRDLVETATRNAPFDVRVAVLEEQNRRDDLRTLLQQTLRSDSMDVLQRVESVAQNNGFVPVREAALQRQIEVSPDPVERLRLQIALARLLEDRGDANAAERVVAAAYKSHPETLGVVRAAVDFQWRAGRREAAIQTLQEAAQRSNATYRRGFTLEAARKATDAQQYAKARQLLDPLLRDEPSASDLIAAMADTWARAGDDRQLREFYAAKLKEVRTPEVQTALRRGLIPVLVRMKDHAGALEQYIEIARRYPEDESLVREASAHARRFGLADQLVAWYVKAEKESPKDARWPMLLARVLTNLERPEQAIEAYTRASTLRPDRPDLLSARAELEDRLLRFEQSAATYARLYELTYRNPSWMVKSAEARARLGQTDAAVAALRKAFLEDRPPQPKDYIEAARRLASWNLIAQAKEFADKAPPDEDAGFQQMLRVRLRQVDWRRANTLIGEAANAVEAYYTPEEKAAFAAALAKLPDPNLRLNIAQGAALTDVTAREMRAQLRQSPGNAPNAAYALIDLQQRRGQFAELAQELEALWKLAPPPTPNRDALLARAAENWRYAGDAAQEVRVLRSLTQTSGAGEWLPRYMQLLARTAPQQLVALAQTGPADVRTSAAATALQSGNADLAIRTMAARGAGLPPVWTKAYTALAGYHLNSKAPEVAAAFDGALGPRTVAAQLATKFDRDAILAGDTWFYYAARYGEYLSSDEYLPAAAESRPASAQSYIELADWLRENGKSAQALEEYARALQVDSKLAIAHQRMAELASSDALAHRRQAFELWNEMQTGRLPASFWPDVQHAIGNAGAAKQIGQLRPQIDLLLRTYIRRTGTFRVNDLLQSLFVAAGATDGLRWVVDLSAAAPVPSNLLLSVARADWLPRAQREPLYREILKMVQSEVASKAGEARNDAEYRLRNARLQWIESLVEAGNWKEAAAALPASDEDMGVTTLALQIAAQTGGLDALWRRQPSAEVVQQVAATLRTRGASDAARRLLAEFYRLQLDSGAFDSSTFMGLAEVLLESNDAAGAVALLKRMVLLVPEPFETLRPAAQLLQRFKQTREAQAFLATRVRAVPWDAAARVESDAAAARTVASDAQAPYAVRAEAASKLTGASGLGSQELDLLASGQPVSAAAAQRPYFFHARMKARTAGTLKGALAIRPDDAAAREALFTALVDAGSWDAAAGVFEPLLRNTMGDWLRSEDSDSRPDTWLVNGFLREYSNRGRIALQLANVYRQLDRTGAARTMLVIAKDIEGGAAVETELAAVQAEIRQRAENRSRAPVINQGVEQTALVRPRLGGAR